MKKNELRVNFISSAKTKGKNGNNKKDNIRRRILEARRRKGEEISYKKGKINKITEKIKLEDRFE